MAAQVSRRRFLKTGCLAAAGVGALACAGVGVAATYRPKIDLPSSTYGATAAGKRVLIAYASKAGSTAEAAGRMGAWLSAHNLRVDVQPAAKVTDLRPYQVILVGSAIRMGALLPEAMTFIQDNQAALRQQAFGVFIFCMTLVEDEADKRKTVSAYLDPVRALVKPAAEGMFAGRMDLNRLTLLERLAILALKVPSGDYRQWDQIKSWTESIPTY